MSELDPYPIQQVDIIVPVYNEAGVIESFHTRLAAALVGLPYQFRIYYINDGSVDGTGGILRAYQDQPKISILTLEHNRGKGSAIRAGIKQARGDFILIQDGDMEYDMAAYSELLRPLLTGQAKVVYGSRFLGKIDKMGWQYRLANKLLVFWTNLLYSSRLTDEATAYKAFDANLLRTLNLRCRRFEFCPEVTGKLLRRKMEISEVPVHYLGRTKEQGKKIRFYDGLIAIWVLFRERFF